MECTKYQNGCQEGCHNIKCSHTDKTLFTMNTVLNKHFVTVPKILVSLTETSLLKMVSVLLGKTECVVASKLVATYSHI